ncbi:MAG: c-type cytochrome [Candidatus Promineifilaceae bacterium]|nr:c-type cytochrome [Candidatus Promineifilaceae bacterium]
MKPTNLIVSIVTGQRTAGSRIMPWPIRVAVSLTALLFLLGTILLLAPATVVGQETTVPDSPPESMAGLAVYSERCANCHGPTGLGDGELAAESPNPPTALASPQYLDTAVPADMFATITNGRLSAGMPPFGPTSSNPLSEASRWDAIAAVYSLGTPQDALDAGRELYEVNCLACHGASGSGDGPEATGQEGDLASIDYWFTTSNQAVVDALNGGGIAAHTYELSQAELATVTDYVRTFSYGWTDALAAFRPLEEASVSGLVINGTTGEAVGEGARVTLRAFTSELDITLTLTDTLDAAGTYQFALSDVPQDWFYRVGVDYAGVEFGSDFGQLSAAETELELPVTVFDQTDDPTQVVIEQLHMVLSFGEDGLQVGELYVVSNNADAIFVGATGDPALGTFRIALPEEAQGVSFQRGFGSVDSFIPATEMERTDSGWADTLPIRPGEGTLTLLAQYLLPYEDEGTFSHPLNYDARGVNLVFPDVGVALDLSEGWQLMGERNMGEAGTFNTYARIDVPAGETITLDMEGRPRLPERQASVVAPGDSNELLIGGGLALVAILAAAVVLRQWRSAPDLEAEREELLEAIALLDEEYQAGEIDEVVYQEEREELKAELLEVWEAMQDE